MSELTDATTALTGATAELKSAKESFEAIREDATQAIGDVNATYAEKVASLTIAANLGYANAVEKASGGRNTLIIDDQGNENIMVVIPRFNCEDINAEILAKTGVDMQLGTGTHPAFQTNGVARGEILVGKYLASAGVGGGCSIIGGVQPRASVNYDSSKAMSVAKGDGWHMMSIHEWAAISLWSLANGHQPRGNTGFGRAHDALWETVSRYDEGIPGDRSGVGRSKTGAGPASWAHDNSGFGVQDLVGNCQEWLDQFKLEEGQVLMTLDNDPSIAEENWYRHQSYFDSSSSSQEGIERVGGVILSNEILNKNGPSNDSSYNYPYSQEDNLASVSKSVGYVENEYLRRALVEMAGDPGLNGAIWVRNYGDRLPMRGGVWGHQNFSGLGSLVLYHARTAAGNNFGFRPTLFV